MREPPRNRRSVYGKLQRLRRYCPPHERRYLYRRRGSGADGKIHVHQAVYGRAGHSLCRRVGAGGHAGRTSPICGGQNGHDDGTQIRPRARREDFRPRRGGGVRAAGGLRGLCRGGGGRLRRGRGSPADQDPVERFSHAIRTGGCARHGKGHPRSFDDRRSRDDGRQHRGYSAPHICPRRSAPFPNSKRSASPSSYFSTAGSRTPRRSSGRPWKKSTRCPSSPSTPRA